MINVSSYMGKIFKSTLILFVGSLLAVASLSTWQLAAQELYIVHFNDTHSHIDPERGGEYKGHGGVMERAAFVDSLRTVHGKKNVLLLHAGDFSQGTSYFSELHGDVEVQLLNALRYDVVALGNHEFDNGIPELARRVANIDCPVVCANYDFTGLIDSRNFKPCTIVRRGGMKIGVIGVLTDLRTVVDSEISKVLRYLDPVEEVNKYASYLKDEKKCDLVICLTHIGMTNKDSIADPELVSKTRNVDLVVGGHSHTFLDGIHYEKNLDGKDIPIVQNGCWGVQGAELIVRRSK